MSSESSQQSQSAASMPDYFDNLSNFIREFIEVEQESTKDLQKELASLMRQVEVILTYATELKKREEKIGEAQTYVKNFIERKQSILQEEMFGSQWSQERSPPQK